MGMNPDTNRFEMLTEEEQIKEVEELKQKVAKQQLTRLVRPDGSEVPDHWAVFKVGERIEIKGYTFEVAYIGETSILFEPVKPEIVVGG